jgi:hypothetical protein
MLLCPAATVGCIQKQLVLKRFCYSYTQQLRAGRHAVPTQPPCQHTGKDTHALLHSNRNRKLYPNTLVRGDVTRRHVRSEQEWHCLPREEPTARDRCYSHQGTPPAAEAATKLCPAESHGQAGPPHQQHGQLCLVQYADRLQHVAHEGLGRCAARCVQDVQHDSGKAAGKQLCTRTDINNTAAQAGVQVRSRQSRL